MESSIRGEFDTRLSGYGGHPLDLWATGSGSAGIFEGAARLGITDAEQLVATLAIDGVRERLAASLGVAPHDIDRAAADAKAVLTSRRFTAFSIAEEADLSLGALEPTHLMLGQRPEHRHTAGQLPASVLWPNRMPGIRDHNPRGTCSVFALTALHEANYQARNEIENFSEQHLYYEAKLIDGHPGACGTWLQAAANALATVGQCRESVWPYDHSPPCNNHGVPPTAARLDAGRFRLETELVNPTDVQHLKTLLAAGSPVAVSFPVFASWYHSCYTRLTGRLHLPFDGEDALGGLAVCLTGYHDDSSPGGGYFVFRNSWGTYWGTKSPYGPGHGTVPYAYLATRAWEGFVALPS